MMISGVPVGRQFDLLSSSTTGWPFANTRVAALVQLAVAQGGAEPEDANAQPATV